MKASIALLCLVAYANGALVPRHLRGGAAVQEQEPSIPPLLQEEEKHIGREMLLKKNVGELMQQQIHELKQRVQQLDEWNINPSQDRKVIEIELQTGRELELQNQLGTVIQQQKDHIQHHMQQGQQPQQWQSPQQPQQQQTKHHQSSHQQPDIKEQEKKIGREMLLEMLIGKFMQYQAHQLQQLIQQHQDPMWIMEQLKQIGREMQIEKQLEYEINLRKAQIQHQMQQMQTRIHSNRRQQDFYPEDPDYYPEDPEFYPGDGTVYPEEYDDDWPPIDDYIFDYPSANEPDAEWFNP